MSFVDWGIATIVLRYGMCIIRDEKRREAIPGEMMFSKRREKREGFVEATIEYLLCYRT